MKRVFLFGCYLFFSLHLIAQPKYEFRGVWIATVQNIDWPKPGVYNPEEQKADFIRILNMHQRNGMNAMVVQIRPSGDAFYPSPYEPWSEWLTGRQGKVPWPYYDPLQFMINETHKRGMEFHAWLNPYRSVFNIKTSSIAPGNIIYQHPAWFLTYGDKKYFDPGNKEAQDFVVKLVRDIVKRYTVDAIHMDDYFYPYKIPGKEFPDWKTYTNSRTTLSKDDWRRSNVDSIIYHINKAIKEENKYCRFGISPFGVWRNKDKDPERGSNSRAGQTNYDDLYADILLWLEKGWIDYVTPQLYREIDDSLMDFKKLTDWWSRYSYGRHVYIGHAVYRGNEKQTAGWRNPNQLPKQINYLRQNENIQGSIFFSSSSFNKNPLGWNDSLQSNLYKYPALIPPMNWIDEEKPLPPLAQAKTTHTIIEIKINPAIANTVPIKYYVVYKMMNESAATRPIALPEYISKIEATPAGFTYKEMLPGSPLPVRYAISAVGKNNNESELTELILTQSANIWWIQKR